MLNVNAIIILYMCLNQNECVKFNFNYYYSKLTIFEYV